jgi:hypothetical protein
MISSLLHILIVTPVIFLWLRARELSSSPATAAGTAGEKSQDDGKES